MTTSPWHPLTSVLTHHRFPTGTVTMLFSDIEGSTQLVRHLGAPAYAQVLGVQRRLLRSAFQSWSGHEVDRAGDGCFAVFKQAPDALAAAVAAQRALAMYGWPEGGHVRVRMGLHTGEPVLCTEGYVGLDVHVTARICASAQGGQILLSQTTCALVEHGLSPETALNPAGPRWLKDLDQALPLFEVHDVCLPLGAHRVWTC